MLSALALVLLQPSLPPLQPTLQPPNLLLITIDDLNDWVGCLEGHPDARTPHIDALAARSALFTNAHCQAPVCTPSRASLFTGKLPSTTGLYFLQPALSSVQELKGTTLLERLADEGYATFGVGKLHHGSGEASYVQEYGGALGGFGPRPEEKLAYPIGHPLWDWGPYPESDGDMPDAKVADWAVARLREDHDKPFALAVGFWRPHVPMYVPEKWFEGFDEVALPKTLAEDRNDLSAYAKALTIGLPAPRHEWFIENEAWEDAVRSYLACGAFVDHQVGRVLEALATSDHADNTIVVLLSDHGFHLGEKERWAKRSLWEESTRVPLMISGPGIAPTRIHAGVGLVDVFPTVLDLCGLEAVAELDGHSLKPLMNAGAPWPYGAITTFGPGNHAVRTFDWRYIRYADGSEELYFHPDDPHEWTNLIGDPSHEAILTRMRGFLPTQDAPPVPGTAGDGWEAMKNAGR